MYTFKGDIGGQRSQGLRGAIRVSAEGFFCQNCILEWEVVGKQSEFKVNGSKNVNLYAVVNK